MIYPFRYNVANVSKSTVAFSLVFNFYEWYMFFALKTSPRHARRWEGGELSAHTRINKT